MYYSMPINMFFIVKNHWGPYFTDNLCTFRIYYCERHDCSIPWILERQYRNIYCELGMTGIREQSTKSEVTRFRMGQNQSPITA
jgi:hypothetical protein